MVKSHSGCFYEGTLHMWLTFLKIDFEKRRVISIVLLSLNLLLEVFSEGNIEEEAILPPDAFKLRTQHQFSLGSQSEVQISHLPTPLIHYNINPLSLSFSHFLVFFYWWIFTIIVLDFDSKVFCDKVMLLLSLYEETLLKYK